MVTRLQNQAVATRHRTDHIRDESFQAVNSTATYNNNNLRLLQLQPNHTTCNNISGYTNY